MALQQKSLLLYGLQVTALNASLDFVVAMSGPTTLQATIPVGYYSLGDLMEAIVTAMAVVDTVNTYTITANRTYSNGTANRVTIATSGTYLSLLFASGPRTVSTIAPLIGFTVADQTGALTYTGTSSAGTILEPVWWGKNYQDVNMLRTNFGSLNISANGTKEAIIYQIQEFFEVQFDYEPYVNIAASWMPFMTWAIQQSAFEWTPDITAPNTVYDVTLESTEEDGQGLSYRMKEMIPEMPGLHTTGLLKFRLKVG